MASRALIQTSSRLTQSRLFSTTLTLRNGLLSSSPKYPVTTEESALLADEYKPVYDPAQLQPDIPRSSLRSLFALYHEASSFVTPENIDAVIDREFSTSNGIKGVIVPKRIHTRMSEVNQELKSISQKPKLAEDSHSTGSRNATDVRALHESGWRDLAVKAALYGSDGSKPGLEIVEEFLEADAQREGSEGATPRT